MRSNADLLQFGALRRLRYLATIKAKAVRKSIASRLEIERDKERGRPEAIIEHIRRQGLPKAKDDVSASCQQQSQDLDRTDPISLVLSEQGLQKCQLPDNQLHQRYMEFYPSRHKPFHVLVSSTGGHTFSSSLPSNTSSISELFSAGP